MIGYLPRAVPGLAALTVALCATAAPPDAPLLDELEALLARPVYDSTRSAAAGKVEQDAAGVAGAVVVRTAGEIRAQGYRTLAEVLQSMPGVHLRYDRAYDAVGLRGVERPGDYASRILLMIDGVRLNEPFYDAAPTGGEFPLDVSLIDRVEYIPGPGSALYGSNALLGVINVVTRSASQLPGLRSSVTVGSARQRKLALTWGGEAGPARMLVGASSERLPGRDLYFPEYDTPEDGRGIAHRQDGETADRFYLKARWSEFTFSTAVSARGKDIPTGSYGAVFDTPNAYTDRYTLADLQWARALDADHELQAHFGFAQYRYLSDGDYGTRDDSAHNLNPVEGRWLSGELRWAFRGWRGHQWLAGIEFQNNIRQRASVYDVTPVERLYFQIDTHSHREALYLHDEWQVLQSLLLDGGLRLDQRFDGSGSLTPRWAALWSAAPGLTLKWLQGRAFREPNLNESAYTDETQKAPPRLLSESLRSKELIALWQPRAEWQWRASAFDFRMQDLIELMPQDDGLNMFLNRGSARARGLETEASAVIAGRLQLRGSWSRQQVTDGTTGARLTDAPGTLLKVALTSPGPWPGSRIGLNAQHLGERLTLGGQRLGSPVSMNLNLGFAPPGRPWSVDLGVYNLSDRRSADPAGPEHLQDDLAQDGRVWRLRFDWAY